MAKIKELIAHTQLLVLGAIALGSLGLLSAFIGPRGPSTGDSDASRYVQTDTKFLEAGRAGVEAFIREGAHPEARALAATLESVKHSVVRVRVQHSRGDKTISYTGSGVVLAGGEHVFTAAHTMSKLDERADCTLTVAFTDGTLRSASVVRRTKTEDIEQMSDWAVLLLDRPAPAGTGLPVRLMGADELVGLLGYPDDMGEREDGKLIEDATNNGVVLFPLAVIGKGVMYMDVDVLAGSVPHEGASGSPFIGLDGAVLGLYRGVRARRDDDGVARFSMIPTSPEGLLDWLATDLPGAIADSH